eukprot:1640019-Rhodomonas_salina.1
MWFYYKDADECLGYTAAPYCSMLGDDIAPCRSILGCTVAPCCSTLHPKIKHKKANPRDVKCSEVVCPCVRRLCFVDLAAFTAGSTRFLQHALCCPMRSWRYVLRSTRYITCALPAVYPTRWALSQRLTQHALR